MDTDMVRLNITLPKELVRSLNKLAGSRKRSRFISEAIQQKIEQIQKQELENLLEEGYRATAKESLDLAKEFESVDLKGWDDY